MANAKSYGQRQAIVKGYVIDEVMFSSNDEIAHHSRSYEHGALASEALHYLVGSTRLRRSRPRQRRKRGVQRSYCFQAGAAPHGASHYDAGNCPWTRAHRRPT